MKTIRAVIAIWFLAAIIALVFGDVSVAAGSGQSACSFLNIGFGARANGLGQAFTAIADDPSALYWNPAGMSFMDRRQIQFSHYEWYQDLKLENLGVVIPMNNFSLGAAVGYLDYGEIQSYDEYGYESGELSAYSLTASISLAARFSDVFSLGITGRYIEQSLDLVKGEALAADAGILAELGITRFGLAAVNFGTGIKYRHEKEKLPRAIRGGMSIRPLGDMALVAIDVHAPLEGSIAVRQGLEIGLNNQLFIRTGLEYQTDQQPGIDKIKYNLGLGLDYAGGRFDYSFIPSGYLQDAVHNISIGLSW